MNATMMRSVKEVMALYLKQLYLRLLYRNTTVMNTEGALPTFKIETIVEYSTGSTIFCKGNTQVMPLNSVHSPCSTLMSVPFYTTEDIS